MENDIKSPVCPSALTRYLIELKASRLQLPVYETVSEHTVVSGHQ